MLTGFWFNNKAFKFKGKNPLHKIIKTVRGRLKFTGPYKKACNQGLLEFLNKYDKGLITVTRYDVERGDNLTLRLRCVRGEGIQIAYFCVMQRIIY